MKFIAAIALAAVTLTSAAIAEDVLVAGGKSPDGLYEVRLVRTPKYDEIKDGSEFFFEIRKTSDKKALLTHGGSGFCSFKMAPGECRALWSPSNQFVALTERDSRHTNKLVLISITPDAVTQLELPNYLDNALGRVHALSIDFACFSKPKAWHDNHLVLDLYFTANGRISYTCEVTLHADQPEHSSPTLSFEAITEPAPQEG